MFKLYWKQVPREPATFAVHLPIYLMGKSHQIFSNHKAVLLPHTSPLLQQFFEDFSSQLWFTYRSRFSPLLNSRVTSDMGWGCMIRSTQMLFARALLTCTFGRSNTMFFVYFQVLFAKNSFFPCTKRQQH